MISLLTGVEIIGVIAGGIFIVGKIEANTKANQEALHTATQTNQQAIAQLANLFNKNMEDMKGLIQLHREQQSDALNREISHIKDLISISNTEMREDIKRLQEAQNRANHLQERIALINASVKSLHKRLDLDPPILMDKLVEE